MSGPNSDDEMEFSDSGSEIRERIATVSISRTPIAEVSGAASEVGIPRHVTPTQEAPPKPKPPLSLNVEGIACGGRPVLLETVWTAEIMAQSDDFTVDVALSNGLTVVVPHFQNDPNDDNWFVIAKDATHKRRLLARFQSQTGYPSVFQMLAYILSSPFSRESTTLLVLMLATVLGFTNAPSLTPAEPVAVLSPSKGAAPSIPVPLVGARLTREELDAWYRTALLSALCFAFVVSLLSKLRVSLLGSRKRYQLVIKRWNEEDDNLHSGNRNGRGLLGNHTLIHEVTKSFNSCIVKPEVEGAEVELRVAPLLDAMGKSMRIREIFGPLMSLAVKNDEGNLGKVHKVWSKMRDVDKKRPTTLRGLLEVEKAAGIHRPGGHLADPSAAIALLWMRRTLMFSIAVLQGACEKDAHLGNLARAAYTSQLEQYHGWLLKNTFTMALSAMPSREEFMQRLAPTVKQKMEREALCIQEMRECTEASQVIIKVMCNLFDELDLEDSRKV